MSTATIIKKIRPILNRYGVKRAALFGSAARGKIKNNSDVDVLVEIPQDVTLLDFIGIKIALEKALAKKVDLVEYKTLKSAIRKNVLKERVPIL